MPFLSFFESAEKRFNEIAIHPGSSLMATRRYAEGTSVSSEHSRAEIDRLLMRYGATSFVYGFKDDAAMVAFEMKGRRIKFLLPMPDRNAQEFQMGVHQYNHKPVKLTPDKAYAKYEQAARERWRALVLCIKAKLESVESRIETFEEAFLPHIVMANGRTIGETLIPDLARITEASKMPPLLGSGDHS